MNKLNQSQHGSVGVIHGFVAALACIIFFTILYLTNPDLLLSPWMLGAFLIVILLKVWVAFRMFVGRALFKESLRAVFTVSVISMLFCVGYYYFMLNYFDPAIMASLKERTAANAMQAFKEGSITQMELDAGLEKIHNLNLSFMMSAMIYAVMVIIGFLYALIFAAISGLIGKEKQRVDISADHTQSQPA